LVANRKCWDGSTSFNSTKIISDEIAGYLVYNDINGVPSLVVRYDDSREVLNLSTGKIQIFI
jgi:hypothetical protein